MYFKQFYLNCLAHASYLIGSHGEAIVVDPQRDVDEYIKEAEAHNLKIKYVIETHLHADFVSGHLELAKRTGANVVISARAKATYPHIAVGEDDEVRVGSVRIKIIETPGHTPESISLLINDEDDEDSPPKILTGDTLFVGDVGRPDLVGADGYTAEAMARMLYRSLRDKLLPLDDRTEVYPAHGAGSLCGRNISQENSSTIGTERATNYALREMPEGEFVTMMTGNMPEIPRYFPFDRQVNRTGAKPLDELPSPPALTPSQVHQLINDDDYVPLDVRDADAFGQAYIPRSINVGLRGQFATWAGILIASEKPIIIIVEDDGQVREAAMRLARVGLETIAGYLAGGIEEWRAAGFETASLPQISVEDLSELLNRARDSARTPPPQIIDVRRPTEYVGGHVPRAVNLSLAKLENEVANLDASLPSYVICAGGYRSSAAASVLARHNFRDLHNVTGGTNGWIEAGYESEPPAVAGG